MPQFKTMARPAMQDAPPTSDVPTDAAAFTAAIAPGTANSAQSASVGATTPKALSKISRVVDLLRRTQGALLTDIVAATGWQPHTARAALTGLKKKGHAIESRRGDKQTTYFLA